MIPEERIPLDRMILSLSEALDHVHASTIDHQRRVAYISATVGRHMGLSRTDSLDLFLAASLHDIGLIRVEDRILATNIEDLEDVEWHSEAGWEVLRHNSLLADAAEIVRYHHATWQDGSGKEVAGRQVPLGSHIIALADFVERSIDRGAPILQQPRRIIGQILDQCPARFHPGCVGAFRAVAAPEAFWLDCVSNRIYSILLSMTLAPLMPMTDVSIRQIAEIFGRVVDAMSRWTATHTAAVSASAVALCELMNFSPREQIYMHTAGWLHDLGKLAVPSAILDRPGRFTSDEWAIMKTHTYCTYRALETIGGPTQIAEWAAFHHERLDGKGYPFRHGADDLTLGSRIMAVADTFAAVAEDRPYRPAMNEVEILNAMRQMVNNGGLDGDVMSVMYRHYDQIDSIRRQEVERYAVEQEQLAMIAGGPQLHQDMSA